MFSNLRRQLSDQRGFTMIEIIVMASVLTIGILSTLVVANATLQTSDTNERRVAATNLAREGIELVRAARDSNWQAYSRELDAGNPTDEAARQKWDCYATTAAQAQAFPPECDPAVRFSNNASAVNYVAYPNVGNGVPYFVQNGGGNPNDTKQSAYLICQGTGSQAPVYTPTPGAGCSVGSAFYRRVTVQRGKNLGNGQYSILVRSYVTWPDRVDSPTNPNDGPLMIEEYLTDWRKFQ
jgi:type II secretory pathway pseudopilin PulG